MIAPKKRIKIFNKLLEEFIQDYNKLYNLDIKFFKIKELSVLDNFKNEIEQVRENFFKCDQLSLKNISLCKKLQLDKCKDFGKNKLSIWKYLHNLFLLTQESPEKSDILLKTKEAIEVLSSSSVQPNLPLDSDMSSIIQDIAGEVSKSLQGKDLSSINPMELLTTLMSGNNNINGIDFGSILKNTTDKIQAKINSGEIDTDKLKTQAENLLSNYKNNPIINEVINTQMKK